LIDLTSYGIVDCMKKKNVKKHSLTKAYHNYDFINSPAGRPLRVLAEFLEPEHRLKKHDLMNTVVFFGSARTLSKAKAASKLALIKQKISQAKYISPKLKEEYDNSQRDLIMSRYYEDACQLARRLTQWFLKLENAHRNFMICSGGGPGIMEAANLGAKKAKGRSIGLNISLPLEQEPNAYQTKSLAFEFHYFFIRKFWFFYPAKAIVAFPGGYGTLDELFELLTLVQTRKSRKYMPIVLYGKKYWEKIINFDELLKWGTISKKDLDLFRMTETVEETFNYLKKELTKHYI
jgi:uncharacterized protein (TIGR00730 family)